ncbi:type II secretion system F family protein [Cellulomonas wangsupingiae]|uniref:Type II secretion system F family protein n=1 Tax=Cellulomonas wangsupingiae TaxID=2968085 RepID=A0ABY5K7R6_9CELL|nr:type II secretion system F family protein [Cellulomonas wangsupingiae]MCC2334730.1 type II secretion system F family protein [Cellulomonas wangsupingiae]MCM0638549.1 type II secretion system F family protein [Cellulomonas wangsupingiae]UUI66314.1 type II secretion system F family protein [Cellulomonas wangsupingiae]
MGVVVGLLLGAGLACVWWSWWPVVAVGGRRPDGWTARVQDTLTQAEIAGVTPGGLVAVSGLVGLVVAAVSFLVVPVPAVNVCFGAFAVTAPLTLVRGRARRRLAAARELWPDVVDHLASGVRAGLSLPEAVAQLGDRGPAELRPPFRAFAEDYRATGRFADSLDTLKDRLADPVADRIIEALRLTRDVGGTDLGRLLRTLSSFLREDLRTRGEIEARQGWTVYAARLAVAAPWVVLAMLATRPEAIRAYDSAAGAAVLLVGAASTVVAYRLMLRVARLPDDPRVLR